MNERTGLLATNVSTEKKKNTLNSLFADPGNGAAFRPESSERSFAVPTKGFIHSSIQQHTPSSCTTTDISGTFIGSLVFCIYHVVFCLAQAAAIARPHSNHNSTGILAKMAALGTITAGTSFIFFLGNDIPAIYPATDLFLAPFLAQMAETIDQVLYEKGTHNEDDLFLSTFLTVTGFGLLLSGVLSIAAARFQLANWGAYLPYSVLCGFFTTIGILMWTLGFSVDTGMKVGHVWTCGDGKVISNALVHHLPSVVVGVIMHVAGRQHPNWVIFCIFATVFIFYSVLYMTGTSIEEAQEAKWLFSSTDLHQQQQETGLAYYGPPLPFGTIASLWRGVVDWDAFQAALPTVVALAFLYVIRCSLHSAALQKNIRSLVRNVPPEASPFPSRTTIDQPAHKRSKPRLTLGTIMEQGYGYAQLVAAVVGGITIAPSVAASLTLFHLNAEKSAPQYGSNLLLLGFYLSDFRLVQYIPKTAFSCLMVLAGIDMCRTWVVGSFLKTKDKMEWAVAPLLVVLSFRVGMLNAIFIGIAASTFLFVANFHRAGTVRFAGSGMSLQSTVERTPREVTWLKKNSYLTQILILENYLFFGNAQSILSYVSTMFDDADLRNTSNAELEMNPLPTSFVPKYIIVDFSMVSGMDTSAVDLFHEIVSLCKEHHCKLVFSGTTVNLRSLMIHAGIRGSTEYVRYMSDLETALAKAEDGLLSRTYHLEEKDMKESEQRRRARSVSIAEDGFVYALKKIDEQHGIGMAVELESLRDFTSPIELKAGEVLVREEEDNGGIYFIETGLMKVTPSSSSTLMGGFTWQRSLRQKNSNVSIGHMDARLTISSVVNPIQASRVARVGQGWVIGGIDATLADGLHCSTKPGVYMAITDCRLHHLSSKAIRELEQRNPSLVLQLYKLLSFLAAKRQETTIQHLDQFVKILNGDGPRFRGSRSESANSQNRIEL